MRVGCPECGKQYKLPDDKIKAQGVKVKCKQCEHVFVVKPKQEDGADEQPPPASQQYQLFGPGGETLGPFPLETVKARIEVGEVGRDWEIAPADAPTQRQAIAALPELQDVTWPSPDAAPEDDFGFGDLDLDAGTAAPEPAGSDASPPAKNDAAPGDDLGFEDDFGFDDPFADDAEEQDLGGGDDLFGDTDVGSVGDAAGGDDLFADSPDEGAAAAPDPGTEDEDDLFADGGDDFDFGDLGDEADDGPSGDEDLFGADDESEADEDPFGGETEAAPNDTGDDALAGAGDDDFDFGDFDDEDGAAEGAESGGGPPDDDFAFDDDFDLGDDATAGSEADARDEAEPAFDDDWGLDFDAAGADDAAAADTDAEDGGEDALNALFDEDEMGADEAGDPGSAPEEDALGMDEDVPDELDEDAFAFGDDDSAVSDREVLYEEDLEGEVDQQVEAELRGDSGEDAFADVEMDANAAEEAEDDELVTTLEQLNTSAQTKRGSKKGVLIGAAAVVLLAGGVFGAMYGAPKVMRTWPLVGGWTLQVHEALNTDFHKRQVLSERWAHVQDVLVTWTPKQADTAREALLRIIQADPERIEPQRMLAQVDFLLRGLVGRDLAAPSVSVTDPGASALLAALAGEPSNGGGNPDGLARLGAGWAAYQAGAIEDALAAFAAVTDATEPLPVLGGVAVSVVQTDLGNDLEALRGLQQALEAQPDNAWLQLRYAKTLWRFDPRPSEVLDQVEAALDADDVLTQQEQVAGHALAARVHLSQDNLAQAEKQIQAGLQLARQHPELLMLRGRLEIRQSRWADANLTLRKARELDPESHEAKVAHARALVGIGKSNEALKLMQTATEADPASLILLKGYLHVLLKRGKHAQAERIYDRGRALDADDAELLRMGAEVALARGDEQAAQARLDQYQSQYPGDIDALLKLAELNLKRGRYAAAEKQLHALIEQDQQAVAPRIQLAEVLLSRGKPRAAEQVLLDAQELDANKPEIYVLMARAYLDLDRINDAEEALVGAQKLNPGLWRIYQYQGEASLAEGKPAEAVIDFERAIELSGDAIGPKLSLARAYEAGDRPGKALEIYQEVVGQDPNNLTALSRISRGYMNVGDWAAALESLASWRKAAPNDAEPILLTGRAWREQGDLDQAADWLSRGVRRFPRNAEMRSEYGWVLLRQGKVQAAGQQLRVATNIEPNNALAHMRLGYYHKQNKATRSAIAAFKRALELDLPRAKREQAETELETLRY